MVSIMMPPLIRFSIIAAAIFSVGKFAIHADQSVIRELYVSPKGFVAGEDTRVWIAYRPDGSGPVSYTKLKRGIVKEAIDYWKSSEFDGLSLNRARRSIDDDITLTQKLQDSGVHLNVTKRSDPRSGVLYLSILVTMDYSITWPTDKMAQQKLIKDRILYALAFWNGVDLQLRHLQDPEVRLRVAGIVIGRNKEAAPYLRENSVRSGLYVEESLRPTLKYWRDLANINMDFSTTAYNAVAVMTDSKLAGGLWKVAGIASQGPPCISSGTHIGGLILPDDDAFGGIQTAVHETGHLLGEGGHDGDTSNCPLETGNVHAPLVNNYGRKWSECSLKHISAKLKQRGKWCMSEPKEYHPPGKPIGMILPGDIMHLGTICRRRGWEDGMICWDKVMCDALYCSNNHWSSPCGNAGLVPEGTKCDVGKVCLDGQCVSNTQLAFA